MWFSLVFIQGLLEFLDTSDWGLSLITLEFRLHKSYLQGNRGVSETVLGEQVAVNFYTDFLR